MKELEAVLASYVILPFDAEAAGVAARIWAGLSSARRRAREEILIAAVAASRKLPLATRNLQDYQPMAAAGLGLELADWG